MRGIVRLVDSFIIFKLPTELLHIHINCCLTVFKFAAYKGLLFF